MLHASPELDAYTNWLKDRGLENTVAASAAAVFYFDLKPHASTLILATSTKEDALEVETLLKRIAQSTGGEASVVLVSEPRPPVMGIVSLHDNLSRVLIFGEDYSAEALSSGLFNRPHAPALVPGPEAKLLLTDVAAKRSFWELLKSTLA